MKEETKTEKSFLLKGKTMLDDRPHRHLLATWQREAIAAMSREELKQADAKKVLDGINQRNTQNAFVIQQYDGRIQKIEKDSVTVSMQDHNGCVVSHTVKQTQLIHTDFKEGQYINVSLYMVAIK